MRLPLVVLMGLFDNSVRCFERLTSDRNAPKVETGRLIQFFSHLRMEAGGS